jgi:stringent starvation protein B
MLSNKPYLMRAFYEWIIDSKCTPILVLDATNPHCNVPEQFIEGGEIVFNISPVAIRDFVITNKTVDFKASFDGVIHIISSPIRAVLAVYAEENGEGLFFDGDDEEDDDTNGKDTVVKLRTVENSGSAIDDDEDGPGSMPPPTESSANKSKPFLKLVE